MANENQFRIWDKKGGKMYYFNGTGAAREDFIQLANFIFEKGTENLICMKFTGEQDLTGANIFEGDIITMYTHNGMSDMEVKIREGLFVGVGLFTTYSLKEYKESSDFESFEIRWNIYENPLL